MSIASVLNGFRLFAGEKLNEIITAVNNITGSGTAGPIAASSLTASGAQTFAPSVVAAAGATQGGATAIGGAVARVIVTVTASTEGVKLPTAAAGKEIRVHVPGTVGVKVYPGANARIDAVATNTALALAAGKANVFYARDATRWVTLRGA